MRSRMHAGRLAALAVVFVCTGCIGLSDFEVPRYAGPHVAPIAGSVSVGSVEVSERGLFHQGFNSGFLGLFDLLFLIARTSDIDRVARSSGADGLEDLWRSGIQERLQASGAFDGGSGSARVDVRITRAAKHLEGQGWVIPSWLLNPIWTLCAGPNGASRVALQVTFDVSLGGWSQEYVYRYDESRTFGLYYGRGHRQGAVLGELCDRMLQDLASDRARDPTRSRYAP